jgi:NAD(P)-dependent dehydrogenase (short-subunit alcohol dehydrogenase family)
VSAVSGPPRGTAGASERFAGKVCVVTGAAAGIGHEIASWLTSEGGRVIATDLDLEAVDEVRRVGASEWAFGLDVRSEASVDELARQVGAVTPWVDVLINNAGVEELGTVAETPPQMWDEVHSVNLRGTYLVTRALLPMIPNGSQHTGAGSIVNVASLMGVVSSRSLAAYCASKAGVVSLTRSLALDLAAQGIRANCVCPGIIETGMLRRRLGLGSSREVTLDDLTRIPPIGYIGTPGDVAAAVAYLASDQARFVTGAALVMDGGVGAE